MPQRRSLEVPRAGPLPFHDRVLMILWPAFVMAAVLEALVFVVVDPASLNWFGVEPLSWTTSSVYSVTFLIFWSVISTSGAITQLLQTEGREADAA